MATYATLKTCKADYKLHIDRIRIHKGTVYIGVYKGGRLI